MKNKYLLDSSAWIEYFAGTRIGERVKDIIENGEILTCILSIAEISDKFSREHEKFDMSLEFIKNNSVIVNVSITSCLESGKIKLERRKTKKDFGLLDAIIYISSAENSCVLITKDSDFEGMKDAVMLK